MIAFVNDSMQLISHRFHMLNVFCFAFRAGLANYWYTGLPIQQLQRNAGKYALGGCANLNSEGWTAFTKYTEGALGRFRFDSQRLSFA